MPPLRQLSEFMDPKAKAMNGRVERIDNHNCQTDLAMSLIAGLGADGAIRACQENCWEGVLAYVLVLDKEQPQTHDG